MKIKLVKYLISFVAIFALSATTVLAVELQPPLGTGSFEEITNRVITTILGLSGVLALIAFIYGGIIWMISGGDPGKITKGKNMIVWAIIGLVVIFISYAALTFIFGALIGGEGTPGGGGLGNSGAGLGE